jgi:hypothetical protein
MLRYVNACLCVFFVLLAGCSFIDVITGKNTKKQTPAPMPSQTPTTGELVSYLNKNAGQIESMEVEALDVEVKKGLLITVGLNGWMVCQKPKNFRMQATIPAVGGTAADLGSNDREFWFWMSKADPPDLFYCSHADVGRVQMNIPIQPDWVLEGMGMATITPSENMRVTMNARQGTIDLVEPSRSPQGQNVFKVTTFNARNVSGAEPQVQSRRLVDEKGREICAAYITQMQVDPRTGILIPKEVKFEYPADRITMRLTLSQVTVNNQLNPQRTQQLFTRPNLPNVRSIDLANYREASPTSGPVRNAIGIFRGTGR